MKLYTEFGQSIDRNCPLKEYPRPQMQRASYMCLNGEWEYAILPYGEELKAYQGKILVPFSPECLLSGVERTVTADEVLYYKKKFIIAEDFNKGRMLLHFGAVDYMCKVYINGKLVGENRGGYYPFNFEITKFLKFNAENEITVEVVDPTEKGTQARGKQTTKRGGIWYTPQSGIWQTVWLESVPRKYIKDIKLVPNIDKKTLSIKAIYNETIEKATVKIIDKGKEKASFTLNEKGEGSIVLQDYKLWSPEEPYLYGLEVITEEDTIMSYFGMRKFSIGKDKEGIPRIMLNNKPYFHNGILDQGYWSDGMYTPPSDDAMIYDIQLMKDMGFNMLRKHIKIEPLRWYYHCDKIGMIVWQDMINGGGEYSLSTIAIKPYLGIKIKDNKYKKFSRQDEKSRDEFYMDSKRMIDTLYNTVSLSVWVPFNEGWGQFDSKKVYDFFMKHDSMRIIDHASGWHDQGVGDLKSVHIYFKPIRMKIDDRPFVISEFGGYSLQVKGHMYNEKKFFGYKRFYCQKKFQEAFIKLYEKKVMPLIKKGLSATVYTELSDVEDECNGLVTYDRKVVKLDKKIIKDLNDKIRI